MHSWEGVPHYAYKPFARNNDLSCANNVLVVHELTVTSFTGSDASKLKPHHHYITRRTSHPFCPLPHAISITSPSTASSSSMNCRTSGATSRMMPCSVRLSQSTVGTRLSRVYLVCKRNGCSRNLASLQGFKQSTLPRLKVVE